MLLVSIVFFVIMMTFVCIMALVVVVSYCMIVYFHIKSDLHIVFANSFPGAGVS